MRKVKLNERQLRRIVRGIIRENYGSMLRPEVEQAIERFKTNSFAWRQAEMEFEEMAEGGDAYGVRQEYYRNWSDDDFRAVLDAMGGGRF